MNTVYFFDIDGTIANVGDRFTNNPPPVNKDRRDPKYQEWLLSIQTPELLSQDIPVRGTQHLIDSLEHSIYLTSRSEIHKKDTIAWLATHNFPVRPIIMRAARDVRGYSEFKETAIKEYLWKLAEKDGSCVEAYNVIVFDDDDKGKLEQVCLRNNWTMFKARSGGIVT